MIFHALFRSNKLSCLALLAAATGVIGGCDGAAVTTPVTTTPVVEQTAPQPQLDQVSREDFNRIAAELALPLFWQGTEGDSADLRPQQLAVLWGVQKTERGTWVADDGFTPRFYEAYGQVVAVARQGHAPVEGMAAAEAKRRELVRKELSQGVPRLIRSDFRKADQQDRAIVQRLLEAAALIEQIHAKQTGSARVAGQVPADDPASRMLLYRNQGPWCVAPATENDDGCNASPKFPTRLSGLYPKSLQEDPKFCEALAKRPDHEKLLDQFAVVRQKGDELEAVPYHVEYAQEMKAISAALRAAASAISSDGEVAFKNYLLAAAKAFEDGSWFDADEAWARMNAQNSKWYLRIGPDETYFEPCNRKAGFHVSFARINQDSVALQNKLDPVKQDMEQAMATLAGKPYKARNVSFHLPDFINIVLNAGDARSALGATIGQSLPNWGPVANEGRGRTVAMTNLYTDPDSRKSMETQAASMLCSATFAKFTSDPKPLVMSTVLHEAAHNLGPSHEYRYRGRTAAETFGGSLAATMEELKAQTAALYLIAWLAKRGIIDGELATKATVKDMVWIYGQISRGMYTASNKPKAYSHLAAIQLGYLLEHGVAEWKAKTTAANKTDMGCMEFNLTELPKVVEELLAEVAGLKARMDKPAAQALVKKYVDDEGLYRALHKIIAERWLREPKATFVYAID